jgi:hypothetical protein
VNLALTAVAPTASTVLTLRVNFATEHGFVESIVLNQMLYWVERSQHIIDGVPWVYNTIAQWHEQIPFFSARSIRRAIRHLEQLGFIRSERKDAHWWNQRKWYSVNRKALKPYISSKRPKALDRDGQIGRFNNKDFSIEEIKETNTGTTPTGSVEPPTHPVKQMGKEVDKAMTGLQPRQTGDDQNMEMETDTETEIKIIQDPHPSSQSKPKLKQTPNTSTHPVAPPAPIPPEIERQLTQTIAPVPLNQNLRKQVLQAQIHVIQDAIALVQQQKTQGKVKNPAGLLVKAIQHQWKPNPTAQNASPPIPDDFNEWFALAHKAGLALGSMLIDGVLCIHTTTHQWEPYDDFRVGFSLPWLKRSLAISSQVPPP